MTKKKTNLDVYSSKTAEKVKRLEEKRAELVEKRNVLNAQIKKVDSELAAANEQWKNEKVAALLELGKKQGFSIDDLFEAVQNGGSELFAKTSESENDESSEEGTEESEGPEETETAEGFGEEQFES